MTTIRLEVVTPGGFTHENHFYSLGDVTTKDIVIGEYFCKAGWCKDLSGVFPTGEANSLDIILDVHPVAQLHEIEEL